MASYRFVVYDIEKSFKKTFDDADISIIQILYWVQVVVNNLRAQYYKQNKQDSYVSTFYPVEVKVDDKNRKYIDLPTQILALQNDAGIRYITYNMDSCCCGGDPLHQVVFDRTTVSELRSIYGDPYTTPKPENPYFYRIADKINGVSVNRIYLLGIECINVSDVEIGILASQNPTNVCNLDDEIPLPDELVYDLISEVLKLGRFVMMIPAERINDGDDSSSGVVPKVPVAPPNVNSNDSEE